MTRFRNNFFALLSALAMLAISGCETMEGAGRDVESAGEEIEDAAE